MGVARCPPRSKHFKRLYGAPAGSVTVGTYTYNALGQRVRKVAGSSDTDYVYDLSGQLIGEYANGTLIREYIYMDGVPLAQVDASRLIYLHADHLGTPRVGTDTNATIVWRWDSDPFGSAAPNEDPDGDMNNVTVNLRFPGQYADMESGHHYNYFRSYDPSIGRYTQSDPIGLSGGLNRYTYVYDNPVNFFDPYGLRVRVRCVNVVGFAKHCYVEVEPDNGDDRTSWVLHGDARDHRSQAGWIVQDDGFDTGGAEGEWNESCGVDDCVEEAVREYPNGSVYRFFRGPNSNTFAAYVAAKCGLKKARGWAPGWRANPPAQQEGPQYPPGSQPYSVGHARR